MKWHWNVRSTPLFRGFWCFFSYSSLFDYLGRWFKLTLSKKNMRLFCNHKLGMLGLYWRFASQLPWRLIRYISAWKMQNLTMHAPAKTGVGTVPSRAKLITWNARCVGAPFSEEGWKKGNATVSGSELSKVEVENMIIWLSFRISGL